MIVRCWKSVHSVPAESGRAKNVSVLLPFLLLLLPVLSGCATTSQNKGVLALVDGEEIARQDLEYAIQIAHRRQDLERGHDLDIGRFVNKLVDEMLIIQEARRLGMDESPDINSKVDAFILRESVMQLFSEEVTGRVNVTEDEIRHYYNEQYRKYIFGVIELDSEDRAATVRDLLARGDDFKSLSNEFSLTTLQDNTTELEYRNMKPFMQDIIVDLNEGEISGIHTVDDIYYIVKLFSRHEASAEGLDKARERIKSTILSQKTKERSDDYLMELRNKKGVIIDTAILSDIVSMTDPGDRQQWAEDGRVVVSVADMTLTVQDIVKMLPARPIVSVEKAVNNWIDRKLVDIEALSRNYATQPGLRERVQRYKNQLVKNSFTNQVLSPKIEVSEQEMTDYYEMHQQDFRKPDQYRIQRITVNTEPEGNDAIQNLQQGADFAWLAKKTSQDNTSEMGGMLGWVTEDRLPVAAREVVRALEAGDVSPLVKVGDSYRIYRLQNKTEGAVKEFNEVKPLIHREVWRDKYTKLFKHYIDRLKKEAEITVFHKEVDEVRQMFEK